MGIADSGRAMQNKGRSPFYPGQPVPVELFVGRAEQIRRVMERGAAQVEQGKPMAFFVEGEYGIGKSSLARYVQYRAEKEHRLLGLYATLGPARNIDDVGSAILKAAAESGSLDRHRGEAIRGWLSRYVGEQSLFGLTIHADALKKEGPNIAQGALPFLREVLERVRDTGASGIMLVLDEINRISASPAFAHFIKGLVDSNALSREPLPLLLMLCGTPERRRQMIECHQPVERVFDIVEIERMDGHEMEVFFANAFDSVNVKVDEAAMQNMTLFSAGFPKIMHLVGDNAFWVDTDGMVDEDDAFAAVINAAEEVGKKYVDQQVYSALRSKDYQSILKRIAHLGVLKDSFLKRDIEKGLTEPQKKKLNNFLQRMKQLNVLRSGESHGEYAFNVRMVQFYIWLKEAVRAQR